MAFETTWKKSVGELTTARAAVKAAILRAAKMASIVSSPDAKVKSVEPINVKRRRYRLPSLTRTLTGFGWPTIPKKPGDSLSLSCKGYIKVVPRITTENLNRSLENCFRRLGSVPKTMVFDNVRVCSTRTGMILSSIAS